MHLLSSVVQRYLAWLPSNGIGCRSLWTLVQSAHGSLASGGVAEYAATLQQCSSSIAPSSCPAGLASSVKLSSSGAFGSRSDAWAWLGVAAGAAAAACSAGLAHADASDDPIQFRRAALASAELAVHEAFAEAVLDHDRAVAQQQQQQQQPSRYDSSSSSNGIPVQSPIPQKPQVELSGHILAVTIPVLPTVDMAALLAAIDSSLDGLARQAKSSSCSQSTRLLGTSQVGQWDSSRTLPTHPTKQQRHGQGSHTAGGNSGEQLKVQVLIPLEQGSPHETSSSSSSSEAGDGSSSSIGSAGFGRISVVKPSGRFTADELAFLARLVAAANKPKAAAAAGVSVGLQPGPPWVPGSSSMSRHVPYSLGLDPSAKLFGGFVADLESDLQGMEQDFIRRWESKWGSWTEGRRDAEQQLQQQLSDFFPPEVVTWLQQFEQVQREQQRGNHTDDESRSSGSRTSSSYSRGGGPGAALQPGGPPEQQQQQQQEVLPPWQQPAARTAVTQLQQLGAQVYLPADGTNSASSDAESGWGSLAGYEEQKQALEDFLLLPLKHPEVFDGVTARTRKTAGASSSRPRAVLFEGPPGTGKTSSARLLSRRAALPLVYVPLEALVSKWYGESEQNMAKLFKVCEALGGCIIFLDELDSLATSRDRSDMHEASRRILGVLLREIDGFDNTLGSNEGKANNSKGGGGESRRSVLIGATNRRQDLDAALLSRFDLSIYFGLPDESCRTAILQQYAAHLPPDQLTHIAAHTSGFAGRDLRDACEQTERQWASRIIRGEVDAEQLPGVEDYLAAVRQRKEGAGRRASGAAGHHPWAVDGSQYFKT